jgi:glycosyltransferase involved in cell wall biosynthesis
VSPSPILYLVNALGFGGAELQVFRLALGMKARGRDVTVVTLIPPVGLADELRAGGVEVISLNMKPGVPNPLACMRLRRIIRRLRPEVVHSHIVHANLLARAIRPFTRIPALVCTAHSIYEGKRWLELAYRVTDRLSDMTTNVSQAGVDRYIQIGACPAERIRFVPNGLDVSRFKRDSGDRERLRRELGIDDKFVWLAVGRLTEAKDCPNLLNAFAAAAASDDRAVLMMVGRGDREEEVYAVAKSLNLGNRVRFLGIRQDIPAVMSAADAYVMSSAWEGMPLVLQEASATELPIVATDVGGVGEVVVRERSGLLVSPKNADQLAGAMRRMMLMTTDERERMGRAGREHVESLFGMEGVLDTWDEMYREILSRKSAPAGSDEHASAAMTSTKRSAGMAVRVGE